MSREISRRSFLSLCAMAFVMILNPAGALGYERAEHDRITEEILFGQPSKRKKRPSAVKALESAVYLCADQMKMDGGDNLEYLRKQGISNLPELEDIALTKEYMKLAGGSFGRHDALTHMGWHFNYGKKDALDSPAYAEVKKCVEDGYGDEWPKRWKRRKKLLVNTVADLLDFGILDRARVAIGWGDGGRCDAFAELLYYIHVLGDYEDKIQDNLKKEKYEMKLLAIPFAIQDASEANRDFFWDVEEAVRILFDNEDTHEEYLQLAEELKNRSSIARKNHSVRSKTSAETFRRNVLMTKRILKKYIPILLAKSSFFSDVIASG